VITSAQRPLLAPKGREINLCAEASLASQNPKDGGIYASLLYTRFTVGHLPIPHKTGLNLSHS